MGAITGIGAAYVLIRRSEEQNQPVEIRATDGIKLGVLVMGLIRSVGDLADGRE